MTALEYITNLNIKIKLNARLEPTLMLTAFPGNKVEENIGDRQRAAKRMRKRAAVSHKTAA
ncbi:MAG: hypothetical protein JWO94_2532 [Verrucomicrobiaceae bacterium]|nr:hypothetical protein [Verrucomicrobiaceae bacterium]